MRPAQGRRSLRLRSGGPKSIAGPLGEDTALETLMPVTTTDRRGRARRAANPSPLTLDGTNTYVRALGRRPRPRRPATSTPSGGRIDGIEGVVLTHSHADHAEGAELLGVPVALPGAARSGPFRAIATPGHSPDSVCLLFGAVCFTGDTCSVAAAFSSRRARARCPPTSTPCGGCASSTWSDLPRARPLRPRPAAKLDEYIAHRLDREHRLWRRWTPACAARRAARRVWSDAPAELRPAAALTLAAHLDKLGRGRLPSAAG